jgi:hypothetical protein
MAAQRIPGPTCQMERPSRVQDGTMCIAPSPIPGPVGHTLRPVYAPVPALSGAEHLRRPAIQLARHAEPEVKQDKQSATAAGEVFSRSGEMGAGDQHVTQDLSLTFCIDTETPWPHDDWVPLGNPSDYLKARTDIFLRLDRNLSENRKAELPQGGSRVMK